MEPVYVCKMKNKYNIYLVYKNACSMIRENAKNNLY